MDHRQIACCADYEGTSHEATAKVVYDLTCEFYAAHPVAVGMGRKSLRSLKQSAADCEAHVRSVAPQACGFAIETLTLISIIINVVRLFYAWLQSKPEEA